jgi:hypothetical protein
MALQHQIDCALKANVELPHYVYIAPFLKQAKQIAWEILKEIVEPLIRAGGAEKSEGELFVRFLHNGAKISLFGADNPQAIRGMRVDGLVVDEVAQIEPVVWDEILSPTLADRQGWALFIGTPHGVNLFSKLYNSAQADDDWFAGRWTCYETEALKPEEIERQRRLQTENAFAREYLCDFKAAGDDQLVSLVDIELAAQREYTNHELGEAAGVLGVDPARFGDDSSAIIYRRGLAADEPIILQGQDQMQLAARVAAEIERRQPDAVFIDQGQGAGVIDRLKQLGLVVHEVPFGAQAKRPKAYRNRRSEMWHEMAEWIRAGGSIPNLDSLKQALGTPIYSYTPTGQVALESKDQIRKRLNKEANLDAADALALTFASPVTRLADRRANTHQETRRGFDPYARRKKNR